MDQDKLNSLLNEGIAAAKSGQAARARDLLMQVVEADENNESAWLWLSGVVESLEDRQVCLENVLALNPDSVAAQKGLAWIDQQRASQGLSLETASPAETPPPETSELNAPPAASPPAAAIPPITAATPLVRYERKHKREKRSSNLIIVSIAWLLFGVVLLMATCLLGTGEQPAQQLQIRQEDSIPLREVAMIAFPVMGILCIVAAVGLLKRVKVAFYASIGLSVVVLVAASILSALYRGGFFGCAPASSLFLALTLLARDDFDMEEVIVQGKRAEYGTGSPLQHYQRGLEYAKEKKLDMAIQEWEKAVTLDPANLRFRNALALALAGANQHPRAIATLEEALKAFPGDKETKSNLEAIKRAVAKKG